MLVVSLILLLVNIVMLPLQLHKFRFRRPDLRNHRKLVVVDGHTGFIGSMNMIKRSLCTSSGVTKAGGMSKPPM